MKQPNLSQIVGASAPHWAKVCRRATKQLNAATKALSDYYEHAPIPKPPRRKAVKARKTRAEQTVARNVRAACVKRDGHCRIMFDEYHTVWVLAMDCRGPSEWAHMHARRRSKTRGMAPEVRHDTTHSLMLCKYHHELYDAKQLFITALTRKGADGQLKYRVNR